MMPQLQLARLEQVNYYKGKIMKVYFDDDGTLVVQATDNTEMVALTSWSKSKDRPLIKAGEHLKVQMSTQGLPHNWPTVYGKTGTNE
jgi:hypothetical protein